MPPDGWELENMRELWFVAGNPALVRGRQGPERHRPVFGPDSLIFRLRDLKWFSCLSHSFVRD